MGRVYGIKLDIPQSQLIGIFYVFLFALYSFICTFALRKGRRMPLSTKIKLKNILKTMKEKRTKGACLAQRRETFACSSLGFLNENLKTSVNTNCKKGGTTLWRS